LAFFFFGMVVTGLAALQFVNVPMFRSSHRFGQTLSSRKALLTGPPPNISALRRLATLLVIVGEAVFLKKMTPPDESWSVYLMVIGQPFPSRYFPKPAFNKILLACQVHWWLGWGTCLSA